MVASQVCSRRRYEDGKLGHEILTFKDHCAGSVTPRAFQTVEEAAIGQRGQSFRGHSRPTCISAEPFKAHSVVRFNADICMHTEAGNHGAAGALEGVQTVSVDLISQTHDAVASIGANRNSASEGARQQSNHPGIVIRQRISLWSIRFTVKTAPLQQRLNALTDECGQTEDVRILGRRQWVKLRMAVFAGINAVDHDYVGYRIMSSTFVPA